MRFPLAMGVKCGYYIGMKNTIELTYYENGRGGIAVSIDDGETVFVKTGRRLPLDESIWEEAEEVLELSDVQAAAVSARIDAKTEARRLHFEYAVPQRAEEQKARRAADADLAAEICGALGRLAAILG